LSKTSVADLVDVEAEVLYVAHADAEPQRKLMETGKMMGTCWKIRVIHHENW
jgi:hypothetical protein